MLKTKQKLRRKKYILRKRSDLVSFFNEKVFMWSGTSVVFFESLLIKDNGSPGAFGIESGGFENRDNKKRTKQIKVLFVVPKRLISSASLRNKVKRRLFEVYRLHRVEIEDAMKVRHLLVDEATVCIGIFYRMSQVVSFQALQNEFEMFLKKIVRQNKWQTGSS